MPKVKAPPSLNKGFSKKRLINIRIKTLYPSRPMFRTTPRAGFQSSIDGFKERAGNKLLSVIKYTTPKNSEGLSKSAYIKNKELKRASKVKPILKIQTKERREYGYFLRTPSKGGIGQIPPKFSKILDYVSKKNKGAKIGGKNTLTRQAYALRKHIALQGFQRNYYDKTAIEGLRQLNAPRDLARDLKGRLLSDLKHWAREVT